MSQSRHFELRTKTILLCGVVCGCAGNSAGTSQLNDAPGTLQMTISRSVTSQIPASADSAAVRVWHPTAGTNQVQFVKIPSPGSVTSVSFNLPARSGYSVGVIAYKSNADLQIREALAGGRADNITVEADQTASASLAVAPWSVTLETTPDVLLSGEPVTYKATITSGPVADFFSNAISGGFWVGIDKWTSLAVFNTPSHPRAVGGLLTGNTLTSISDNAPTVSADTAVFIQARVAVDYSGWQTQPASNAGPAIYLISPSFTAGDPLSRHLLKVPAGSLTVQF